MSLGGKVAIVTGGSTGIGRAICLRLAKAGANIAFNFYSVDSRYPLSEAEECATKIKKIGRKVIFFECDCAQALCAKQVIEGTLNKLGRADILVNNAGIAMDSMVWKMTEEQWDRVLEVNLGGNFKFTREVAPIFRKQNWGRIISISSINGLRGKMGQINYSASKAGIIGFTKAVAKDLGKFNVTANIIAPGWVDTEMTVTLKKHRETALKETILGRFPTPDKIASLVEYLCSNDADCITGTVIRVDSGQFTHSNEF